MGLSGYSSVHWPPGCARLIDNVSFKTQQAQFENLKQPGRAGAHDQGICLNCHMEFPAAMAVAALRAAGGSRRGMLLEGAPGNKRSGLTGLVHIELQDFPLRGVFIAGQLFDRIGDGPVIPFDDIIGPIQDQLVQRHGPTKGL